MDSAGHRFKLAGVSWYGGESSDLVPLGLDHADLQSIAHLVKTLGFNSVRLPWANQLYEQNPVIDSSLLSANPQLQGKRALEVLDAVIDALAREGLVVILDNHRSRGDWCCDTAHGDGLWHTAQVPEAAWIADWVGMAQRYASQPAVIGADLRNEIRPQLPDDAATYCTDCDNPPDAGCGCWNPSWGDNNLLTDWAAASERGGNAILQANPNLLIVVEGDFWASWFGANYHPVTLAVDHRLVYSPHNYAASGGVASYADYAAYKAAMDSNWGYLVTDGKPYTAPVWVGEFGANQNSPDTDASDLDAAASPSANWWIWIRQYMTDLDLDWSVWALNGTQGPGYGRVAGAPEGFGVLAPDWKTPAPQPFIAALQAMQPARLGP
jgi:endoglucanase